MQHQGVLIVRLRMPNRQKIHERIMQAIERVPEEEWPGLLLISRDTAQSMWRAHPLAH